MRKSSPISCTIGNAKAFSSGRITDGNLNLYKGVRNSIKGKYIDKQKIYFPFSIFENFFHMC